MDITAGENSDLERVHWHVPRPGWGEWHWEPPPRVHPSPAVRAQLRLSTGMRKSDFQKPVSPQQDRSIDQLVW